MAYILVISNMDMGKHSTRKAGSTTISISAENHDWLASLIQRKGESFDDILTRIRKGEIGK